MLSLAPRRTDTSNPAARADIAPAAAEACPYDPNLIASLKSDHAVLRDTLEELETCVLRHEFAKIPPMLARFRDALQHHLDEEREHFYRRVALHVQDDPEKSAFVQRVSTRMDGIARQVMIFTKHYRRIGVSRVNRGAFRHDLEVVAALMGDRIDLEESSLYALYQPAGPAGHPQAGEWPRGQACAAE